MKIDPVEFQQYFSLDDITKVHGVTFIRVLNVSRGRGRSNETFFVSNVQLLLDSLGFTIISRITFHRYSPWTPVKLQKIHTHTHTHKKKKEQKRKEDKQAKGQSKYSR